MYNPIDIQRIDKQIEDLQRIKASYQGMPQQPINNIITTATPQQNPTSFFEARFTTENPSDILVNNKTAFINLKDGKLSIKEVDGEIKEYFLILPKDEKDLKIENLEMKLREMEMKVNEYTKPNRTIDEQSKSNEYGDGNVTKPKSKGNFFKPNE